MMKLRPSLILAVLTLSFITASRADDAADQAKWRANVEKATHSIEAGGDDIALIIAFYQRASALYNLKELDKATADIDATLEHVKKLPQGQQEAQAWVQTWGLKGDIDTGRAKWGEAIKDYEAAQKRANFATVMTDMGVFYYNLSRAYAHTDAPFYSRVSADHALKALEGKTGAEDVRMRMLALRQRAIALYGEGDLAGAQADWTAAKAIEPKLGDAPFDVAQVPLNKAALNGREKEHMARARFLLGKAQALDRRRIDAWLMGIADNNLPTADGGTIALADATGTSATPLLLVDDALNDLDYAFRCIGETWGLQDFDIALERGKARALRSQQASDDHRYSLHDVDEEFNRAVKLRPLDLDARRARAD